MTLEILAKALTKDNFLPFGDVIEVDGLPDKIINQGLCGRYHDLAQMDFGDGRAGISLFNAEARSLPYRLELMERHPHGSQAFIPVTRTPMLVIVANDVDGKPDAPRAFISQPAQSVNIHRNIWHGVLAPLGEKGIFAVVDRIGSGANLEEHWFDHPYTVFGPSA